MITGIGTDIVETRDVENYILRHDDTKRRIFTTNEINYCESKNFSQMFYAARFAAKEAFLKAAELPLSTGLGNIEIVHKDNGAPAIIVSPEIEAKIRARKIHVSISHALYYSTATVILET